MKGEEVSSEGVLPATPKSEDDTIADVKTENDIKEDESEEVNVDDILEGNNDTAASSPDRKPSLDEGGSTLHPVRPKPVLPVAPAPPGEDPAISPCHKPPTTFSPGRSSRSGSTSGNGSPSVSGGASLGLGSPQSQPNVGSPLSSPQTNHQAPVSSSPQLFQPFLPAAALAARAAAAISEGGGSTLPLGSPLGSAHGVRPLPFSIDNILKPTFGGKEDGMMGAFPSPGSPRFPFPAAAAFLGTAFPGLLLQHQQQSLLAALAGGGAAPGGLAPTKENSLSLPPPPHNLMTSSPSSSSMTSLSPPADRFASPSAVQPVSKTLGPKPVTTTSPKFVTKVKQEPPPPARSPEKGTLPKEAIDKLHKKEGKSTSEPVDLSKTSNNNNNGEEDGDVPPGMVRGPNGQLWPAWVFCTRYSDRPSSGPRSRKIKKAEKAPCDGSSSTSSGEKRPRTAFSSDQLNRLKREFDENRYLTEERRRNLAEELGLNENQIKIWFQNKRAKLKKNSGQKGDLAQMLMAQGLYNHSTVPVDEDDNPLY